MTSDDVDLLRRWLDVRRGAPGARRSTATPAGSSYAGSSCSGPPGDDLVDAEAAADRSSSGHQSSLDGAGQPAGRGRQGRGVGRGSSTPHVSNRDFEALVAGLWTPGQEELVAPYVARYLEDAPRIAAARVRRSRQEVAFAAPRMPMALDRLQRLRDDLEAASGHDRQHRAPPRLARHGRRLRRSRCGCGRRSTPREPWHCVTGTVTCRRAHVTSCTSSHGAAHCAAHASGSFLGLARSPTRVRRTSW